MSFTLISDCFYIILYRLSIITGINIRIYRNRGIVILFVESSQCFTALQVNMILPIFGNRENIIMKVKF